MEAFLFGRLILVPELSKHCSEELVKRLNCNLLSQKIDSNHWIAAIKCHEFKSICNILYWQKFFLCLMLGWTKKIHTRWFFFIFRIICPILLRVFLQCFRVVIFNPLFSQILAILGLLRISFPCHKTCWLKNATNSQNFRQWNLEIARL